MPIENDDFFSELLGRFSKKFESSKNFINIGFDEEEIEKAASYTLEIAKYILKHKYDNIIFVDISARGIASPVSHALYYMQLKDGKKSKEINIPHMMFIDPNGIEDYAHSSSEAMKSYKGADREGKTLIIDTCSHTGKSLDKINSTLSIAGFDNINSLVISGDTMTRKAKKEVTKIIDPNYSLCYPFGRRIDRGYTSSIHTVNLDIPFEDQEAYLSVNRRIVEKVRDLIK